MEKEYIVLSRQDAVTKTGSPYINIKVADNEENMTLCVWDVPRASGPKVGQLVKFLSIKDNAGKKSANSSEMVVGSEAQEGHPLYRLIPRAVAKELWDETIEHLVGFCKDEKMIEFIKKHAEELYPEYAKYPAATSVHHAFPGGLLNHTYQMFHLLEGIYPVYPYPEDIKIERIVIGVLFHDWGKLIEYTKDGETREQMFLLGHVYMSANYLNNLLREAGIDKRETNFIVHTVLSHHGELEFGSPVKPCTPDALLINHLDNISAKADVFNTTGNMEKSFALGTSVVK